MNELGRDKLREAALKGVRQIKGRFKDDKGGMCALGVLGMKVGMNERKYDLKIGPDLPCELCHRICDNEAKLIIHLNDDHDLDFLAIANKV